MQDSTIQTTILRVQYHCGLSGLLYGKFLACNDHSYINIDSSSYGIRAIDTSPYYGPSEIVLGNALSALREEFPRSSYKLVCHSSVEGFKWSEFVLKMTKCGRYGTSTFDYAPTTIRESVKRSLQRLQTDYLDSVYLHDAEFVATSVAPRPTGNPTAALKDEAAAYGLAAGDEAKIHGEGDQKILDAFHELQKLKEEGLVKNIGITGLFPSFCFHGFNVQMHHTHRLPSAHIAQARNLDFAYSSL